MKNSGILSKYLTLFVVLFMFSGCAYFNTFYLAKKNFNRAEKERIDKNGVVRGTTTTLYTQAIKWSSGILENHMDSKYVDDSLYIIGMSYFYQEDFLKARIKFDELLGAFPESELVQTALYFKARSLMELDLTDDAMLLLLDLVDTDDPSVSGLAGLAITEISLANEDWPELLSASQKVIDREPNEDELITAIFYKSKALFELERYEDCSAALNELADYKIGSDQRFEINTLLASSEANLEKYEIAMSYLESMENRGDFADYAPRIRLQIGNIYELREDEAMAMDTYRKLAGDFPDSLAAKEAWYNVGKILIRDLSESEAAQEAFDMVKEGSATTNAPWFVEAGIKSVQIDSMTARIEKIDEIMELLEDYEGGSDESDEPVESDAPDEEKTVQPGPGEETVTTAAQTVPPDSTESSSDSAVAVADSTAVASDSIVAVADSAIAVTDSTAAAAQTVPPDSTESSSDSAVTVADSTAVALDSIVAAADSAIAVTDSTVAAAEPQAEMKKPAKLTKKQREEFNFPEMIGRARFSLAELYNYSFERPDAAIEEYKFIMSQAPGTEYAVKSDYFVRIYELQQSGEYADEAEDALMNDMIADYPESGFAQELKVFLGLIENPPDVKMYIEAEVAYMNGEPPDVYLPLYQKVVEQFPLTESAYRARFVTAYAYEHHLGDMDRALFIYEALADEEVNAFSTEYVNLAVEKLKMIEQDEELLEELAESIAYYEMRIEEIEKGTRLEDRVGAQVAVSAGADGSGYTGRNKIRARNARIRSRYYKN